MDYLNTKIKRLAALVASLYGFMTHHFCCAFGYSFNATRSSLVTSPVIGIVEVFVSPQLHESASCNGFVDFVGLS